MLAVLYVNKHGSDTVSFRPRFFRIPLNLSYYFLPDCFNPYMDFRSLQTRSPLVIPSSILDAFIWTSEFLLSLRVNSTSASFKPPGTSIYNSSSTLACKYAVSTSIWWSLASIFVDNAVSSLIDSSLATGAKVSSKSNPGLCEKPLATIRAFCALFSRRCLTYSSRLP